MVLPFPGSHGWYTWQPVLPTLGGDWYLHVIKLPETQWRQLDAHKESTIISTRLIFPSVIITTNPIFGKYNIITILSTLRTHTHIYIYILLYNNYIYICTCIFTYLFLYNNIIHGSIVNPQHHEFRSHHEKSPAISRWTIPETGSTKCSLPVMKLGYWLVVDLPVWKTWKSVGMIIPNTVYGKIKNVPNHQPGYSSKGKITWNIMKPLYLMGGNQHRFRWRFSLKTNPVKSMMWRFYAAKEIPLSHEKNMALYAVV